MNFYLLFVLILVGVAALLVFLWVLLKIRARLKADSAGSSLPPWSGPDARCPRCNGKVSTICYARKLRNIRRFCRTRGCDHTWDEAPVCPVLVGIPDPVKTPLGTLVTRVEIKVGDRFKVPSWLNPSPDVLYKGFCDEPRSPIGHVYHMEDESVIFCETCAKSFDKKVMKEFIMYERLDAAPKVARQAQNLEDPEFHVFVNRISAMLTLALRPDVRFPTDPKESLAMAARKWRFIAKALVHHNQPIHGEGSETCALCNIYCKEGDPSPKCQGCPVAKAGHPGCQGTAFYSYRDLRNNGGSIRHLAGVANEEADFLESLQEKAPQMEDPEFMVVDNVVALRPGVSFPSDPAKALEMSIRKWDFIVRALKNYQKPIRCGETRTCALCHYYGGFNVCNGCPVMDATGRSTCAASPFIRYKRAIEEGSSIELLVRLATEERNFLASLRKKAVQADPWENRIRIEDANPGDRFVIPNRIIWAGPATAYYESCSQPGGFAETSREGRHVYHIEAEGKFWCETCGKTSHASDFPALQIEVLSEEFYAGQDCILRIREGVSFPTDRLNALRMSVRKWRFMARWIGVNGKALLDGGFETCALCRLFHPSGASDFCSGCPVKRKTGSSLCHETPYLPYDKARRENAAGLALAAARDEVEFLKSLLAEELVLEKAPKKAEPARIRKKILQQMEEDSEARE